MLRSKFRLTIAACALLAASLSPAALALGPPGSYDFGYDQPGQEGRVHDRSEDFMADLYSRNVSPNEPQPDDRNLRRRPGGELRGNGWDRDGDRGYGDSYGSPDDRRYGRRQEGRPVAPIDQPLRRFGEPQVTERDLRGPAVLTFQEDGRETRFYQFRDFAGCAAAARAATRNNPLNNAECTPTRRGTY